MHLLLLAMILPAAMLVWHALFAGSLPGCGPTSACAQLANSRWGSASGIPVSMLGLGYAIGLMMASAPSLLAARTANPLASRRILLPILSLGGLASAFYLLLMAQSGRWCGYCLWFHLANLAFVAVAWKGVIGFRPVDTGGHDRREAYPTRTIAFRFVASYAAVVLIATSVQRMVDHSADVAAQNQTNRIAERVINELTSSELASPDDTAIQSATGFTGRHPRGRQPSAARLVVFQDYQCGDCRDLETELQTRLSESSDLHVSIRQFPLCDDCNPAIHYPWFHPSACRAAAIAEAAFDLAGEKGFWQANDWLFQHKGECDDDQIAELAVILNVGAKELLELAQSDVIKQRIASDVQEGISLGIASTPFVFLNGVAIEGAASDPTNVAVALDRIEAEVQRLQAASQPIARHDSSHDARPPQASDRVLKLWQEAEPIENLPDPSECQHVLGNPDATDRVVLFLEPTYSDAGGMWRMLKELADQRQTQATSNAAADVRIELYLYPISRELNPRFAERKKDYFPRSTTTTRLLKAVTVLGDDEAFDAAMQWLSTARNQVELSELPMELTNAIADDRWTLEDLQTTMQSQQVADAIKADIQQADQCKITWAPNLIIQHRISPSDTVSAESVMRMLDSEIDKID